MKTCRPSDTSAKADDVQARRSPISSCSAAAIRAEIGGDVDRVGDEQERDDGVQQRPRIVLPDVGGEAVPGHPPMRALTIWMPIMSGSVRTRPQHAVAKLRARLRIARDAARIVVRGRR